VFNDEPNPDAVEREIRLNEAWHAADEMAREHVEERGLWGEEAERVREDMRELYAFDTAPVTTEHAILRAEGVVMPPADTLDDESLHAILWEVIDALAGRNTFLSSTDHLSDRELYHHLESELFHEPTQDLVAPGWNHHIDILGGCSEEDIELSLRFYQSEEDRAHWKKSFPEYELPPKEKPPFDRDRHLPKPKY
jgi:hypothetical protein